VLFDCQACGACCCNTKKNIRLQHREYIEVMPSDPLFRRTPLLDKLTVLQDNGTRHMLLTGEEQRCAALEGALGEGVKCTIYHFRPEGCRQVTPGDEECLRARKSHPQVMRMSSEAAASPLVTTNQPEPEQDE
jgi:Fe-S-cluster containining protein